jgi:hypothetical protein
MLFDSFMSSNKVTALLVWFLPSQCPGHRQFPFFFLKTWWVRFGRNVVVVVQVTFEPRNLGAPRQGPNRHVNARRLPNSWFQQQKMVSEKKLICHRFSLSHFCFIFFSADSIFQLVSTNISIINSRRLASNWFNENAFILFCFVFCFVCSHSAQYFCTFFKLSRIFSRFRGQWSKKLVSFRKLIKKLKGLNCCRLTKHFGSMSERTSFKSSLSCLLGADQQM